MTGNPNLEKLQHLWLQQLQLEFEEICIMYGLQLRPPVFEISDAKKLFYPLIAIPVGDNSVSLGLRR